MSDQFDDLINSALGDFHAAEALAAKPMDGPATVRSTVAHRRRVRITTLSVLTALVIVAPIAAFAANPRGNNSPPVLDGTPTPTASPSAEATASPSPSPSPASGADLIAAIIAAKPVTPAGVLCPAGQGSWRSGEKSGKPGYDAVVETALAMNLDADADLEIVAKVSCAQADTDGEPFGGYVVAFDRDPAGKIATLGVVAKAEVGGVRELVGTVSDAGNRVISVLFLVDNYDNGDKPDTRTQARDFKWDGAKFAQVAGSTSFMPLGAPPAADLALTVSNMTVTELGTCQYVDGTMTLERKGTVSTPGQANAATHDGLEPGESVTLTAAMSTATCFAGWSIDASVRGDEDNTDNNTVHPLL